MNNPNFCKSFKEISPVRKLNLFLFRRLVKFLSPVCVIVRALKHGLLTDKVGNCRLFVEFRAKKGRLPFLLFFEENFSRQTDIIEP